MQWCVALRPVLQTRRNAQSISFSLHSANQIQNYQSFGRVRQRNKFRPQIASAGMCKWIISDWKNVECSSLSPNKESKDFVQVSWSTALRNCRKLSPTLNTSKIRALCKTSRKVRRRFASVRILVSATENYEEFSCTIHSEARHKITSEYYSRLLINKLFVCARCNC